MANKVATPKRPPPKAPMDDSDTESAKTYVDPDSDVPIKAPPIPFEKRPRNSYEQPVGPAPMKVPPFTPSKEVTLPKVSTEPVPASLADLADDRTTARHLRPAKAPTDVAKAILTGITAKAASELGVNAQDTDSALIPPTSVSWHEITFTLLIGTC